MELTRPAVLEPSLVDARDTLPLEHEAAARDAFWSCVLALSTLADAAVGGKIIEETMAAIGWTNDDGDPLSATHIRSMCAQSLHKLAELGAYGTQALAPVDRLDIYRALLRA